MSARNRGGRRTLPFSFLVLSFSFLLLVRNTASAATNVTTSGDSPKMPGERWSDDASNAMQQLLTGGRSMRGAGGGGGGRGRPLGRNTSRNATAHRNKAHHGHRKHKGFACALATAPLWATLPQQPLLGIALLVFI